jgi:hypothetical protein
MEYFDSEAILSIDLQIEHVFNENWRDYLLRDLESMYSVFCTMASALQKYSIYSCVFYFYSTIRGIIRTEIWRVLQQCEYCRFWQPWNTLCVDLIGPYTLKGKDGTVIDFMCVTMIDPATSWFEIVELPVSQLSQLDAPRGS